MNEAVTQDHFSKAIQEYQQGILDEKALYQKFDALLADNHFATQQSLAELREMVSAAGLPAAALETLQDKLAEPKTRIVKMRPKSSASEDQDQQPTSASQASSLLHHLMQWQEGDQQKEIKPGQIIRGTYRLEKKIGKGGMGEVWKAVDLIQDAGDSQDKYVAIKFINHEIRSHPYALKALVREFARYKKLIHRNIVKAYEINRDETEVFIVMEFLEGQSLKDFIKQHPKGISLKEAKPIIGGMCKALNHAHREGIIHLDFKPGNVFYNSKTRIAKVIDFGIARLSKKSDRDKTRFDPGKLGAITTAYASIEMLMQEDPDPRDDIYGLACVVYELLSGKHPFNGGLALIAEREKLQPKPIKGLTADEFKAIKRGLCFDKKNRTANAEQFFQELYSPGISAKRLRLRRLIIGSIIAAALVITPIIAYKGYDYWHLRHITSAIQQQKISGINDFKGLSYEEQIELLKDDKTRIALVQFPITSENYQIDAIQFLQQFSTNIQQILFKQRDVRALLIPHYIEKIKYEMAADDFVAAENDARRIMAIYPDSKSLTDLAETIRPKKLRRMNKLERQYHQCLKQPATSLLKLMPCLQDTRNSLAKISRQHNLLEDPKLSSRYATEIAAAIAGNDLNSAKQLLADWRTLIPEANKQRQALEKKLQQNQEVSELIGKVLAGSDMDMPELIDMLLSLDSAKRAKVLQDRAIEEKLHAYFSSKVNAAISRDDYISGLQHIATAARLLPNLPQEKQYLGKLKTSLKKHRSQRLAQLTREYKDALQAQQPDISALREVIQKVKHIEPGSKMLQYPGAAQAFAGKIDAAIAAGQFDLADQLLKNWAALLPTARESDNFRKLAGKRERQLQAWQARKIYSDRLQQALQNNDAAVVKSVLAELQEKLSPSDRQHVVAAHRKPLLQFYRQEIDSALQMDNFPNAEQIYTQALALFPKESAFRTGRQRIARLKTTRLKNLAVDYQRALNSTPLSGKEIFTYLEKLRAIDKQYLARHSQLFSTLKTRLVTLAKDSHSLPQLQDVLQYWDRFFNGGENATEAREIYRETKNLISLRCLYNGRKLKQQGNRQLGDELLMFALSLDPISTVRNALENELQK